MVGAELGGPAHGEKCIGESVVGSSSEQRLSTLGIRKSRTPNLNVGKLFTVHAEAVREEERTCGLGQILAQ
jgi:hypothetical protein